MNGPAVVTAFIVEASVSAAWFLPLLSAQCRKRITAHTGRELAAAAAALRIRV